LCYSGGLEHHGFYKNLETEMLKNLVQTIKIEEEE